MKRHPTWLGRDYKGDEPGFRSWSNALWDPCKETQEWLRSALCWVILLSLRGCWKMQKVFARMKRYLQKSDIIFQAGRAVFRILHFCNFAIQEPQHSRKLLLSQRCCLRCNTIKANTFQRLPLNCKTVEPQSWKTQQNFCYRLSIMQSKGLYKNALQCSNYFLRPWYVRALL